ncbi:MAG: T9SS type A sorting domain-containing protein [Bacteroidales bacterium]|nr:T9SS type A sorting domain-containing protein [Bacteroidales bacterium]
MKKFRLLSAAFLMMGLLFGTQVMAQHIELGAAKSAQRCASVTDEGFTASFSFSSIDATEVSTEKGAFSYITMENTYPSGNLGDPTLPAVNKLIAIPYGVSNISVEVKNYTTKVYSLSDFGIKTIYPQQMPLRKDQKPGDIPFAYNEKTYNAKGFIERPIAEVKIKGTMRGIQIGALTVNPVQYDAATNSIRVYNDIEVEVRYSQYDKSAAYNEFARTFSPYFANVYGQMFNWRDDVYDEHPDLWQNPVHMLIIADRMFEECLQPWYTWKTTKGFFLNINYTDEIGTSAAAIRTFIQEEYDKEPPTFLMIMGDKNQVAASATGSETHCVTDLQYSSVDGDEFPDMYHSRFPAETVAQMEAMINKALEYEQYTMPDPTYLNNVLLIAGEDSGWGVTVGRPTIWYATNYYFNEEHGYDQVHEFSHGVYTGCYSWLNEGVGFANYTAHGSNTSWAGPQFTVSDVNNLTNEHKYFLAMGNCCEAADWGISGTCFGEAMVRAENKAAYAYIGSCPSTYWLNDYYFGVGATNRADGTMPSYEETTMGFYDAMWTDGAYNTVTSMMFIGNLASNAAQALGYTLHCSTLYDWQAYHTLGDGSILPFRVQPTENTISHLPTLPIGMDFFTVNANPGSYVGISKDGVLYGAGMVGESGTADIAITPITSGGDVTICVTHPQYIPYTSVIPAAAMDGPYVTVDSFTPASAHVGDETPLNITFKNVGTEPTNGTTNVTLTCEDNTLTILNGVGSFGNLDPDATTQINGFSYSIAEGVADGTRYTIQVAAVCGSETWEGKVIITAGEAVLQFEGMANAGGFVPGETLTVTASFKNVGHYMATNAIASIASTSEYVTIENETVEVGTIDPTGVATCAFNITVDASCPTTEQLPLTFTLNADGGLVAEGSGVIKNACNVIFDLVDSYGDGWNGNELVVSFSDGTPTQNMTISSGSSATYTLEIGRGVHVTLSWINGSYSYECSFTVKYEDGTQIYSGGAGVNYEFDCDCAGGTPIGVYNPVENLQAEATNTSVTLTWNAPEGAINYIISRNGIEIGQTAETTYTDVLVSKDGVYTYCVVAEYTDGVSVPECVIVEFFDAISENEVEFSIYPNPVNSTLTINGGAAEYSYAMFNGMGQMVANGKAQGTEQINVSEMTKGVYFLRLTTGTQVRIEKVVVE